MVRVTPVTLRTPPVVVVMGVPVAVTQADAPQAPAVVGAVEKVTVIGPVPGYELVVALVIVTGGTLVGASFVRLTRSSILAVATAPDPFAPPPVKTTPGAEV